MAADYRAAALDAPARALCDYAVEVTLRPWTVGADAIATLRGHGFSDTAILEATHVIGFFNHINRMADALDVDLEPEMPPHPNKGGLLSNPYRDGAHTERDIAAFQRQIAAIFGARDRARGLPRNFMWLTEEVGELSRALSSESAERQAAEFADVFAWLCTLADEAGVDLAQAAWARYGAGCPRCHATPCTCPERGAGR